MKKFISFFIALMLCTNLIGVQKVHSKGFFVIGDDFFENNDIITKAELGDDSVDLEPEANFRIRTTDNIGEVEAGTLDTFFIFDASSTRDDNDNLGDLEFRFDFNNDGTPETFFSQEPRVEYQFKTIGTKEVRMDVLDSVGNVGSVVKTVKIVRNTAPESYFTIDDNEGTVSQEFVFRPIVSDGQHKERQLEIRFDFDGNGAYDTEFSRVTTTRYKYKKPGTYKVVMQTRDPGFLTSTYSDNVFVTPSTTPNLEFTLNTDSGNLDTKFIIDTSGSSDRETPRDLEFRYDFDYKGENDIVYDTDWSRSRRRVFRYKKPGEYVVRVEARDPEGIADVAYRKVLVSLQ